MCHVIINGWPTSYVAQGSNVVMRAQPKCNISPEGDITVDHALTDLLYIIVPSD